MSNLTSSIVKGFGFTLGRKAANSLIESTSKNQVYKSSEIDCWSHKGYEENDVEISYDYNYYQKQMKWYSWILFLVPIVNLYKSIPYFYNVFIKKNKVYYYDMKWVSFKISDGRVKGGIKEVQKLKPELGKVEIYPPSTRNKIESVIALAISIVLSTPIFIGIYQSINK
jgi:hypothetical protein